MSDILKMARVQLVVLVFFMVFKVVRRKVLASDPHEVVEIFFLSFPNFCEGVIGVLTVTMIGLYVNRKLQLKNELIYLLATLLAAVYVITQELKIHNLGGNNIYDLNDVIFSIIGLVFGFFVVWRMKPKVQANP